MMPDLQALWRRICVKSGLASTQYAAVDCAGLRAIKQAKPEVGWRQPGGVWRNRSFDPAGSDTRGAAAYDESYADTRKWVQQGLLDYIAPQIYWPFARDAARYDVLTKWWADVVKPTHPSVYRDRVLQSGRAFQKRTGLDGERRRTGAEKQLDLNDSLPDVKGTILFREDYLNQPQTQEAVNYLRGRWGS